MSNNILKFLAVCLAFGIFFFLVSQGNALQAFPIYRIEANHSQLGQFKDVSGLDGMNGLKIILKFGKVNQPFLRWCQKPAGIRTQKLTIDILKVGPDGNILSHWRIINAFPSKYAGPGFNAKGNDVGMETLELAHEGITRVDNNNDDNDDD